jgi:hypothetical protein
MRYYGVGAWCVLSLATGCGERNQAPTPMPLEQIPAALQSVAQNADADVKAKAAAAIAALKGTNVTQALFLVQALANRTDLTSQQQETIARCLLTVVAQVQSSATNGNEEAAAAIQYRRESK